MLALFAFLIFLRERLPPIPVATWVDRTVITSVVMILICLIENTGSYFLGTPVSPLFAFCFLKCSVFFVSSNHPFCGTDSLAVVSALFPLFTVL